MKHCWTRIFTGATCHKQISGSYQMVQTSERLCCFSSVSLWHHYDKWSAWLFTVRRILSFSEGCRWGNEASLLLDFHVPSLSLHQKFTLYCYVQIYSLHETASVSKSWVRNFKACIVNITFWLQKSSKESYVNFIYYLEILKNVNGHWKKFHYFKKTSLCYWQGESTIDVCIYKWVNKAQKFLWLWAI